MPLSLALSRTDGATCTRRRVRVAWTSGELRTGLLRGQRASSARPPGAMRGGLLESSPGRSEHGRLWRRRAQTAPAARSTSGTGAGAGHREASPPVRVLAHRRGELQASVYLRASWWIERRETNAC
jgi:hypothetical protein